MVEAQLIWDDPTAQVMQFLRDETNTWIVRDIDGSGSPVMASTIAATGGGWSLGVKIKSGAVSYDVLVDTTAQ